ncbi:hypothetical protein EDC04DRAFT_591339 [Pisolithus marmoratus]|nr:hypothetical protein EDC04DRAFT_591339 [Pisolithus marmoratus]
MVVGVTTPTPIHLLDTVAVALTTAAAFATCQGSMLVLTRNDPFLVFSLQRSIENGSRRWRKPWLHSSEEALQKAKSSHCRRRSVSQVCTALRKEVCW